MSKHKKNYFSTALYIILVVSIFVCLALNFLGIIAFDKNIVLLIAILSAVVIIPMYDKFAIKDFVFEKNVEIKSSDESQIKEKDSEDQKALDEEVNKNTDNKIRVSEIRDKIKSKLEDSDCFDNNKQIILSEDKINNYNPIFTWFDSNNSMLIEPKYTEINTSFYNKLYVMLSKIIAYNKIKNANLKLKLVVVCKKENEIGVSDTSISKLEDVFSPSIDAGIFRIQKVSIDL